MSRRASARMLLVVLLLQTAWPALAQVAPANPPRVLGEVTLFGEEQPKVEAATKTEVLLSKSPAAVTVITAKQIGESGAKTVADLLRLVSGVNVRWNPMTPTIDVRGFGENPFSNRLLLLIDGIPYNSGDTGGFPLSPVYDSFPVQTIKRIEIVRGPGSSLYGENAYWGVINIVTLSADDLSGGDVELFGGSRDSASVTGMYGGRFGSSSILGSVRFLRTQFPLAFWQDDRSHFRASDIFLKGGHRDVQVEYYRHSDRLDGFREDLTPAGLPPGSAFQSAHELTQTLEILAVKYNHQKAGDPFTFSSDISYAHRFGMHCAGCHAAQEKPQFGKPANHGYQLTGDFRLGVHMIPGHDILLGVEGRRLDRADHKQELSDDASAVSGYNKLAVYAQDQMSFLRDRLHLVAGARYDGKTTLFAAKTSPRLAAVFSPDDRTVLRASYGTAFRFPNFSELYQASWFLTASNNQLPIPPFPLAVFQPNQTLRPEEIQNFEIGGEYQISPTISAKLDGYRSRVKNFVVIGFNLLPPPQPATIQFLNQPDRGTVTGAELELRTNITPRITGLANYAYQTEHRGTGAPDATGKPMEFPYAPKNKFNLGGYFGPFNGVRGSIEYSWRDKYVAPQFWYLVLTNFTDPTVRPFSAYGLLNARASYDVPVSVAGKSRSVRLSLLGNNLTNERPRETLVGVDTTLAGRQFFGQVELHF
jgi:outer membrane receptor protein involved in Fe transport